MKNNILLVALLFVAANSRAAPPPFKPGDEPEVESPIGRLGYRIGTYLTVEGTRAEKGKVGVHTLLVDTINRHKLAEPVGIWVENLELPKGERCVLKGYETGKWIGTPNNVLEATGMSEGQAPWQFRRYFLATSVEQPTTLKLEGAH